MDMTDVLGTPKRRKSGKATMIRYALEEMKFLKSFNDMRNYYKKIKIILPRVLGTYNRFYGVPPVLQIEPTNRCNADCICCPSSRSSRTKGDMEISLFRRIIDDAAEIGVDVVHLFLHGEPMLHPRIVEKIHYLKSRGLAFHMTTNGVPLTEEKARGILTSGVDISDHVSFSILAASKEVYNRIFRRDYYERAVRNIRLLLDLRKRLRVNGPIIETVFYRMPENEHEESKFIRKWRGVVDHVRVVGDISQSFSEYKQDGESGVVRTKTCMSLWERMTVFWNGNVTMCCQDVDGDCILGNLNGQSIKEIWQSRRLLTIKKTHEDLRFERIPLCHTCDM